MYLIPTLKEARKSKLKPAVDEGDCLSTEIPPGDSVMEPEYNWADSQIVKTQPCNPSWKWLLSSFFPKFPSIARNS